MKKKWLRLFLVLTILISVSAVLFFTNKVSADTTTNSYCCEKLQNGGWCQSVNNPSLCATGNGLSSPAPTSCQSTSYCMLGTCVNSQQGTCLPNTPQQVCQNDGGFWSNSLPSQIPQCQLGCCFIGDQAAFVTQTRCNALAAQENTNSSFRTDITDEQTCLASANPTEDGACVIDHGFGDRNCRRLPRSDCQQLQTSSSGNTTVEFHAGLLCSATTLATNCGPSTRTTCLPDKVGVYFLDTCGNVANIYDSSKIYDKSKQNQDILNYWTNIIDPTASCGINSANGNAGSASCGNCDYISGSICKQYQRGNSQTPTAAQYGNYVCADLSCHYNGQAYKNGETWCPIGSDYQGINTNSPGSLSYTLSCFNGEVTQELCDNYRDKICYQSNITTGSGIFRTALCVVNQWQDCTQQKSNTTCLDATQRDCQWIVGTSILADSNGLPLRLNTTGFLVSPSESNIGTGASCVPKNAPGFDFWLPDSQSAGKVQTMCAFANNNCVVKFQRSFNLLAGGLGPWECAANCWCIGLNVHDKLGDSKTKINAWFNQSAAICYNLGDCGNKNNYIGVPGYSSNNSNVIETNP